MSKPSRYRNVVSELCRVRGSNIIEVGTWNGDRAVEMVTAAAAYSPNVTYHGFDLFETGSAKQHASEFNLKQPSFKNEVAGKLNKLVSTLALRSCAFAFKLHVGNTRDTLLDFALEHAEPTFDFAWIDGGHSVGTIAPDWYACSKLVKPGGVLLLDDYYTNMPDPEFTEKFGCNKLVHELVQKGVHVDFFGELDPVRGGGFVQIARVINQ